MKIYFLSLFPELINSVLESSVLGRALRNGVFSYEVANIRDYALDAHKSVDDRPYGGGPGMVMRADILEKCLLACFASEKIHPDLYDRNQYNVVITTASGDPYTQAIASSYTPYKALFIVCGHYEGIDQRFIDIYADREFRIGEYVLTGGELPALVMADSIIRLLPDALGSTESVTEESFSFSDDEGLLLEYPHYTRPSQFQTLSVPDVLTSGNHAEISSWRLQQAQQMRSRRK